MIAWARAEWQLGNSAATVGPLTEYVIDDPLAEPLLAELMRALHATGRTAEALACYRPMRRRLADELGIDPGPHLQQMYLEILRPGAAFGRVPLTAAT